jgi:hypothetical protein
MTSADSYSTSVSGPGALVTAIPALLGFIPEHSLVLITLDGDGGEIGTTMRHDLSLDDGLPTPAMLAIIDHLTRVCESYQADRVVGVIIDNSYDIASEHYQRLFAIVDRHLMAIGGLYGGFVTPAIVAGAPWKALWDSRSAKDAVKGSDEGVVGDPMISPVAIARAVAHGRRVLMTRGELVDSLSLLPHCADPECDAREIAAADDEAYWQMVEERSDEDSFDDDTGDDGWDQVGSEKHWVNRVAASLDQTTIDPSTVAQWAASASPERIALREFIDRLRRLQEKTDLEYVLRLLDSENLEPGCADLRRLDKVLREFYVRDSLLALAVTQRWIEAERLWTYVARRLRGRGQAAAATLLGFIHYAHGNGAMAGNAFDVALRACPDYSMAVLYSDALTRGIPPGVINRCAETGYVVARSLGVVLPEPVLWPAA